MKAFKFFWNDIRQGKNIDLYVAAPGAFVVVLLNLLGIVDAGILQPFILAILGVLVIAALSNQHALKGLSRTPSVNNIFLEKFPSTLNPQIASASDLWLVGVSLTTPLNSFYSLLEDKLKRGDSIKVLLVNPDPEVMAFAEARSYMKPNVKRASERTQGSIEDYFELKELTSGQLTIKTIRHPIGNGIVAINPDMTSGTLYITNYPFKTRGGSLPKFVLHAQDGRWYDLYREELKNLWESGEEWKIEDDKVKGTAKSNGR